jgi:hypothetical protein
LRFPIIEKVAGTTLKATLVSSGATINPVSSALFDINETLVNSIAATSSGDGHYYAMHLLPNTRAWYINQWIGVIEANTYVERQFVHALKPEVD